MVQIVCQPEHGVYFHNSDVVWRAFEEMFSYFGEEIVRLLVNRLNIQLMNADKIIKATAC